MGHFSHCPALIQQEAVNFPKAGMVGSGQGSNPQKTLSTLLPQHLYTLQGFTEHLGIQPDVCLGRLEQDSLLAPAIILDKSLHLPEPVFYGL